MDLNLQGKVIIVSGGAKGIGEGIVRVLAKEGAIPFVVGRNAADNEAVVASVEAAGGKAMQVVAELTEPEACAAAVAAVLDQCGRIDGLVNNAGVNDGVGLEKGSYEAFMASLHRNLVHYYLLAHHALPSGAAVFTKRLASEANEPFVCPGGSNEQRATGCRPSDP